MIFFKLFLFFVIYEGDYYYVCYYFLRLCDKNIDWDVLVILFLFFMYFFEIKENMRKFGK